MPDGSVQEMERDNKIDLIPLLFRALKQFRRSWWIGLLAVLVCGALGFLYARFTYSPKYEAKASFVVSMSDSTSISTSRYYNSVTTEQLAATFPYILTSGALNKVVANDLGVSSVPGTITAEALGEPTCSRSAWWLLMRGLLMIFWSLWWKIIPP